MCMLMYTNRYKGIYNVFIFEKLLLKLKYTKQVGTFFIGKFSIHLKHWSLRARLDYYHLFWIIGILNYLDY